MFTRKLWKEEGENIIDAFSLEVLTLGLVNADLKSEVQRSRKDIKKWLRTHPDDGEILLNSIVSSAKRRIIDKLGNKINFIEEIDGEDIDGMLEESTLLQTYYYQSYFKYNDHAFELYKIPQLGGIFKEIADTAESDEDSLRMFLNYVMENKIEEIYSKACKFPAPLIGSPLEDPLPRIIYFEDEHHIYMEFWSIGDVINKLDFTDGEFKTINSLHRTVVGIHLDDNLIEYTSENSTKRHKDFILKTILKDFNPSKKGRKITQSFNPIKVTDKKIRTIKKKLSTLSTLDDFRGSKAILRFTSVQNRNVETDPIHEATKSEREYRRTHPRILIGRRGDTWELIPLMQSHEDDRTNIESINQAKKLLSQKKKKNSYDEILQVTTPLNSDTDTFRIWKTKLPPTLRQTIFHLIYGELQ